MKHLKKCTMRLLSVTLAAVMALFAGITASAKPAYQWGIDRSAPNLEDRYGYKSNGSTKFSVDDKVHTDNSWYSIRFDIADYGYGYVEKSYNVEPYTTYKFSAMVKYSGFQAAPDAPTLKTGAYLSKASYYDAQKNKIITPGPDSDYTTSSEWKLLEYEFTTGNETTYGLRIGSSHCKGTVWFSDIKLEKAELTNSWNILAVFFKNVDATVSLNGETKHHEMSLTEDDIEEMNKFALDTIPYNLQTMSNNKMTINSIDRYYIDEVLTEKDLTPRFYQDDAKTIPSGYMMNYGNSELISKVLDKYLAQKHYNQIIVFVPLNGINGWWGLTGVYKNATFIQISNTLKGAFEKVDFPGAVVVHEMCHGLERVSKIINGDKTPTFDDEWKYYQTTYNLNTYEWYKSYMNATLPDGRGIDPRAFYVSSGKYTLVNDDMTTGVGIEPGSSSVAPPAPKNLKVEAVEDDKVKVSWSAVPKASGYQFALFKDADFNEIWKTYDCKPDHNYIYLVPITKGKPYYYAVRTAAAVDGETVYSDWTTLAYTHEGVESTMPAPKNLKVEAVEDDKFKGTWDTVPGASGYQFALFKDADFNEIRKTYDCKPDHNYIYLVPITKGKPYYYAVRTVASVDGKTVYSDWTTLAYTHEGVKVVRGDIDNNGVFNINDIAAAVSYFFSGEKIDKRTADAVGISGRDNINVQDIATLVDWFLKS